jgi:hypothetical protein
VYFHVITDGSVGSVTQADIDTQINIMNFGFAGFYGGANTRFKFRLAGVTRTANAAWFNAGPGSPAEREMKQTLSRGVPGALNYYSTTAGAYLGWAYLPGLTPTRMYLDGIVVDWESMYKTSPTYAGRFDLGFTAVHEAGHWLNLEHTFYGGSQRPRRLRGRHAGDEGADEPLSGRQGHVPERPGPRSDSQLHGLLRRPLLHGVDRWAGVANAGRVPLLPRVLTHLRRRRGLPPPPQHT